MKKKKSVRGKIGVAKGFGPMHAENAKEGQPVDLTKIDTDTVDAKLTPRESVLNRNASELAGRGNIEKLNAEGNKLARKGVDLAAQGDNDVDERDLGPMLDKWSSGLSAQELKVLGPLFDEFLRHREVVSKMKVSDLRPDLLGSDELGRRHADATLADFSAQPQQTEDSPVPGGGAAGWRLGEYEKGTSDMKSKPKSSKPQSGSPYVQAFQNLMPKGGAPVGYQAGGDSVPGMGGGLGARDQYGRQFSNRDASGGFASGNGVPPSPFAGRGPGGVYPGGLPGASGPFGEPGGGKPGPFPGRGPGGVYPDALGMPGMQGPGQMPTQNIGSLQPYLPGNRGPATGLADGTSNVGPIGTPPQGEQAYGPPVNLTAPQIQQLAKQTGISPAQIMALTKAFQGGKDIYNSVGTGGGYANQSPSAGEDFGNPNYIGLGTPSYQGGISDIGYPPFVAPSANYDGNRGGWLGPYDPSFMIQRYAGGTSYVSPFR